MKLNDAGIRASLDDRDEKLGYRLRESVTKKTPYVLIIGDKEKEENIISFRKYGSQDTNSLDLDNFIQKLHKLIKERR